MERHHAIATGVRKDHGPQLIQHAKARGRVSVEFRAPSDQVAHQIGVTFIQDAKAGGCTAVDVRAGVDQVLDGSAVASLNGREQSFKGRRRRWLSSLCGPELPGMKSIYQYFLNNQS